MRVGGVGMKRFVCLMMSMMLLCTCLPVLSEDAAETVPAQVVAVLMRPEALVALRDRMTADMKAALPEEAFSGLWAQLEAAGGAYLGMADDASVQDQQGYHVWTQTVLMSRINLACTVVLDGDGMIAGMNFSPAPAAPETHDDTEEAVVIGEAPWQLPGTLTLPEVADGPVPAVVLVHGSGPNDRDESVGAVKPFRDLARALSKRGIAVLRYDKRTYVYGREIASAEDFAAFSVEEETIQDAIAAGRLLREDSRIDPERIYLLGHSLGGMLAPRIASESDGLFAGIILANGSNHSLLDILLRQLTDALEDMPQAQQEGYRAMLAQASESAGALRAMTAGEALSTAILGQSAYYYWEMAQHPTAAEYLQALAIPTLIINGGLDFQVNAREGREGWEAALDMDAPWLTCLWPEVNHLLMRPEADASIAGTADEYNQACTVDDAVTQAIADFILNNGGQAQ